MKATKITAGLFAGALMLAAGSGVANAQSDPYTPGTPTTAMPVKVPTVDVKQGETLALTGTKCKADDAVTIKLDDGTVIGTGKANAFGAFNVLVVVPVATSIAVHPVTATCAAGPATASVVPAGTTTYAMAATAAGKNEINFNVLAGKVSGGGTGTGTGTGSGSGGSGLARTGSDLLPLAGIAGAAILLGGAFIYGARRPREA